MYIIEYIKNLCLNALISEFPNHTEHFALKDIEITCATQEKFGHYQCNSAMKLCKKIKLPPKEIAHTLEKNLSQNSKTFSKITVDGPGFLNMTLSSNFLTDLLSNQLNDPMLGVKESKQKLNVVLDYSCPNIAKEMHVGHLRSTIIGDCIAHLAEFLGHNVLKLNHIGDWGTQFGMLIAYLKEHYPEQIAKKQIALDLPQLMSCYKLSKEKFDQDKDFKTKSQQEVVKLQAHEETAIYIWEAICDISRKAYQEIYDILGVKLIERGESFYNPMLKDIVKKIEEKNLVTISNGAKCVYLEGYNNRDGEPLPLMIQKTDKGFNYATTDLAAVYHRTHEEKADWIIYVTDAGQSLHFEMVFKTAALAGFYDPKKVRINHVPFGLVLRGDGKKFKTRSGDTEKLIDLINTAINKTKDILLERNKEIPKDELENNSKILGINAIKYADLANHRTSNYKFCYDRMLQFEGNTAAFLTYAYVRIQSIKAKVNKDISKLIQNAKITLENEEEIAIALHLVRFADVIKAFSEDLLPHRLAEYLYKLAEKFHVFFHKCRVEGHCQEDSRLLICEAITQVMQKGFYILGLILPSKM